MSEYLSFQKELTALDIDLHPSELHGLLVGYVCGTKAESSKSRRLALYDGWIDGEASAALVVLLEAAYDSVLTNLDEYEDFEFRLLVPEDEAPVHERVRATALWCSGFLSGLGESGGHTALDEGDVAEGLKDLGRIAQIRSDVPESEENEQDLAQIEEFVRVSVLLVFSETGSPDIH